MWARVRGNTARRVLLAKINTVPRVTTDIVTKILLIGVLRHVEITYLYVGRMTLNKTLLTLFLPPKIVTHKIASLLESSNAYIKVRVICLTKYHNTKAVYELLMTF